MDIRQALMAGNYRDQMLRIAAYIGADAGRFEELMALVMSQDRLLVQRASWPLSECVTRYPALLTSRQIRRLLRRLSDPLHPAATRHIMRSLEAAAIPDALAGTIMDRCFRLVMDPGEPVAGRVFALGILGRLARRYPEIGPEIRLCVEAQWAHASPAFRSRARKTLAGLQDPGVGDNSTIPG